MKFMSKLLAVLMLTCMVSVPAMAAPDDGPRAGDAVLDILVARPLGIAVTGIGAVLFVVSLPFSALGRNVGQAGKMLVGGPFQETFLRCLGCRAKERYAN